MKRGNCRLRLVRAQRRVPFMSRLTIKIENADPKESFSISLSTTEKITEAQQLIPLFQEWIRMKEAPDVEDKELF